MDNPPNWSEQEKVILHNEALIDAILRLRGGGNDKDSSKGFWQHFLNSASGAALITVLVGGLLGQWISWSLQQELKDRDSKQLELKEYMAGRQEVTKHTYDLIGSYISSADDLIVITRTDFDPGRYPNGSKPQKDLIDQRTLYRNNFNTADSQWGKEQETLGLLMTYYNQGKAEVLDGWRKAQASLNEYTRCAEEWYLTHENKFVEQAVLQGACKSQKDALKRQLAEFTAALQAKQ